MDLLPPKKKVGRKNVGVAPIVHNHRTNGAIIKIEAVGFDEVTPGPARTRKRKVSSLVEPQSCYGSLLGAGGPFFGMPNLKGKKPKCDNQALITKQLDAIKQKINLVDTIEELGQVEQKLFEMRKHVQQKIAAKKTNQDELKKACAATELAIKTSKSQHPLLIHVVVENLVNFINEQDLSSCRHVCKKWDEVIAGHLKKICWTSLGDGTRNGATGQHDLYLNKFLSDIRPGSALFPLTKFTVFVYNTSPSIHKFFGVYAQYIKKLDLRYDPPPQSLNGLQPEMFTSGLVKFLLPSIPNCDSLYLNNFSCQLFTTTTSLIKLPKRMNLKFLEVELNCKCVGDDTTHLLTSNTFLVNLISINPLLETFNCLVGSKHMNQSILKRIMTMLFSYSKVSNIKHLGLNCTREMVIAEDFGLQPKAFQLKSLQLKNVLIMPVKEFVEHHANTLEKLVVDIDRVKWDEFRREHDAEPCIAPKLPQLKELNVVCLTSQEDPLVQLLTSELFPKLEKLKFFNMNEKFIQAYMDKFDDENAPGPDEIDTDNIEFDDESPHDNQIQVKYLEVNVDELQSPLNHNFLRHTFYGVQHLTITTSQACYITPIWTSQFHLKSLNLIVSYDDTESKNKFFVQHLDTILTGFSVNDCERIYHLILSHYFSRSGFQLETFNVDWFESICQDKEYPSIRNLSYLQKLSINCKKSCNRLTEVTLATLLVCIKTLTAIHISNCSINQNFVKSMKKQLSPSFFMDIV